MSNTGKHLTATQENTKKASSRCGRQEQAPEFPPIFLRKGISGKVLVEFRLNEKECPTEVKSLHSDRKELEKIAEKFVSTLDPFERTKPIDGRYLLTMDYRIIKDGDHCGPPELVPPSQDVVIVCSAFIGKPIIEKLK